jgi:hypothetical protein
MSFMGFPFPLAPQIFPILLAVHEESAILKDIFRFVFNSKLLMAVAGTR